MIPCIVCGRGSIGFAREMDADESEDWSKELSMYPHGTLFASWSAAGDNDFIFVEAGLCPSYNTRCESADVSFSGLQFERPMSQ